VQKQPVQRGLPAPGVAVVAATGDNGYGVQFPAASPTWSPVGGTTLIQNSATGARRSGERMERGGLGLQPLEPKPSWQHDTGL